MEFIEYSKCSTCKKAKHWLDSHNINYVVRAIKEDVPKYEEISLWISKYNIPIKKLFNTSGLKYKELNLKEKLDNMSQDQQINLLSSDGMLIKRPLLVAKDKILIGFKETEWLQYFNEVNEKQ
jgi:arsenate reductase